MHEEQHFRVGPNGPVSESLFLPISNARRCKLDGGDERESRLTWAYRIEKERKLPLRSCTIIMPARTASHYSAHYSYLSRSDSWGRTVIATSTDVKEKRGCRFESMPHYHSDSKHNNGQANSPVIIHCADITRLSLTWKYKSPRGTHRCRNINLPFLSTT